MNLFIISFSKIESRSQQAKTALKNMVNTYPELDPKTIWSVDKGKLFVGSIQNSEDVSGPRKYKAFDDNHIILYDGLPMDSSQKIRAHNAEELLAKKDNLTDFLEGRFVVVSIQLKPFSLNITTDPLGLAQVYYTYDSGKLLVSNSVGLIKQIVQQNNPNTLGVSSYLTLGWTVGDSTLDKEIKVIPGGQVWSWKDTSPLEVIKKCYFEFWNHHPKINKSESKNLSTKLTNVQDEWLSMVEQLSDTFGELYCPLTGGKDSRLIAALLEKANIEAFYYTCGLESSTDFQIAKEISETLNLDYRLVEFNDISTEEWQQAVSSLVSQNDGFVSLWQLKDYLFEPVPNDRLGVVLTGLGGEIVRSFYGNIVTALFCPNKDAVTQYMNSKHLDSWDSLVKKDAIEETGKYNKSFFDYYSGIGVAAHDLMDVFYAVERVRRWAGSQSRKLATKRDYTPLFVTRSFLNYAFSLSSLQRFTEPLHYTMTRNLSPLLYDMKFDSEPWRVQIPALCLLQQTVRKLDSFAKRKFPAFKSINSGQNPKAEYNSLKATFDKQNQLVLEKLLSDNHSLLWDFVDKKVLEIMVSSKGSTQRVKNSEGLYRIMTLYFYFS